MEAIQRWWSPLSDISLEKGHNRFHTEPQETRIEGQLYALFAL
jgi:hypothetical protein